jgi:hypothetical protein
VRDLANTHRMAAVVWIVLIAGWISAGACASAPDPDAAAPWTCDVSAVYDLDGSEVRTTAQFHCPSIIGRTHIELWDNVDLIAEHADFSECNDHISAIFHVTRHMPSSAAFIFARTDSFFGNGPAAHYSCMAFISREPNGG